MNNINMELYKKYIINTIDTICPSKNKRKYSDIYYLENMIYLLNDLCRWKSLNLLHTDKNKFHWKTIENKFRRWSKLNIFKIAYEKMLSDNILCNNTSNSTIDLVIDASDINNMNGKELIEYGKNKKKKQTKISLIADTDKNVYSATFYSANVSDTKTIITSINEMKDKFKFRKINLIGDKGYICQELKNELKKDKIDLIYPNKKNMAPTSKRAKNKLKKRYTIEHTIKDNKRNNRIAIRKDRLINTYSSFLFLSMIINLQKFLDIKNLRKPNLLALK
jgi:hypothetical protein